MGDTGARGDPGDSVELPNNLVGDQGYKGYSGEIGKFSLEVKFFHIYGLLNTFSFFWTDVCHRCIPSTSNIKFFLYLYFSVAAVCRVLFIFITFTNFS